MCLITVQFLAADGLVHMSCFIMLQLSSERELAIRLNEPFEDHRLYGKSVPFFSGCYGDYLILSFIKILSTSRGRLLAIGECLLTTVLNLSPYLKSLSSVTVHRLLALFEQTSLLTIESSSAVMAKCSSLLIDIFCLLIQYQYDGNVQLIAGLMRKRSIFEDLSKMTFQTYSMMTVSPSQSSPRWTESEVNFYHGERPFPLNILSFA